MYQGRVVGLLLGLAVCAMLGGATLMITLPTSPSKTVYGAITGLGFDETDHGSLPYAHVSVGDRRIRVTLPRGSICRTGDRVVLAQSKMRLGYRYDFAPPGCTRP
jgi:hypothetical protein